MASTLEINTGTLGRDISSIEGEIKKLEDNIIALRTTLSQLEGMWDGPAKTAFSTAVNDDIERLSTLVSAIKAYTVKTEDAKTAYETCERNVSGIISSIRV